MHFDLEIDKKFKKLWKAYLLQSLLAGIAMFILVLILGKKNMVVVAIFIMVIVNAEHPPAAGTAFAVVINEVSIPVCATIILSTIVLTQVRYYLRHRMQNLV